MTRVAIFGMLILSAAVATADPCTSLYDIAGNGGKAWLGINSNGYVAGEGQSFTVDCPATLESVSFQLVLDGLTWNGAPPLRTGNILLASVRMPAIGLILGTAMLGIGFDVGTEWITFDFSSSGIALVPGEYLVTCAPAGSGQGRLSYWQGEDSYTGGVRYLSQGGTNGPWVAIGPASGDLAVKVQMNVPTPAETVSWSEIKTLYR